MRCPRQACFPVTMEGESVTISTPLHQFYKQKQQWAALSPRPGTTHGSWPWKKTIKSHHTCPEEPCPVIEPANVPSNLE